VSWTNYFKKGFASIAIILLGVIMLFAFGFNKSFDYTGGTIVSVTVEKNIEKDVAIKNVKDVLNDHKNIEVCSFSVGSSLDQKVITVKYSLSGDNTMATNDAVLEELFTKFGYDQTNAVQKNFINMTTDIQPAYNTSVFTYALLGVLIATLAVAVYMFLRLGLASAITLVATTIIDILCGLAFILIFRIEISAHIGYASLAIATLSLVINSIMLSKQKEIAMQPDNKKLLNSEISEKAVESIKYSLCVFTAISVVVLLSLAIIAFGTAGSAVLSVALGLISIFITTLFINPSLWSIAFVRKNKPAKKPIHEQVESEVE
jgi:preprotein translocase subunit SecF